MNNEITLILLDIRSAHNVGAIFRTAECLGAEKIYLSGYTPEPGDILGKIRSDFAKTALGAEKNISWERVKNIGRLIKKLKKENIFIASLEQSKNSIPLDKFSKFRKFAPKPLGRPPAWRRTALILGNEVRGIPKNILKISDAVLEIPMRGKKESLNVSVAAGIALFELAKNPPA